MMIIRDNHNNHLFPIKSGDEVHERISNARVFIVGAGGLGSPVALYLAAAGIGTIGIIDGDIVDLSNLQRQIIHYTDDLNRPKVISAKEKIEGVNPDINVRVYHERITSKNIMDIFSDYDVIVDGTDNFPAKFLINDGAVFSNKPLVHGGILRFTGQVFTILPNKTACYRCIFKAPPPPGLIPSCQEAGVLGVLAGVIGTIQASEVIKIISGEGETLTNRILTYDALKMGFREVRIERNSDCPICGNEPEVSELVDYEQEVCTI
ncbi:MAG: ThiF family adenylyltransferase [Nitrospirota bacterium]